VAGGEKASVGTADGKFADENYANAACARSNFIAVGRRWREMPDALAD